MEFWEILYNSLVLIFSFNIELYQIILLSLKTSGLATIIASFFGIITGYYITIYKFRFKKIIIILLNSLMGIPPVVAGLFVYFMFSAKGPLGVFSILYTPTAMVIAQIVIVFPIAASLMRQQLDSFWFQYKDSFRAYNFSTFAIIYIFCKNCYNSFITILFSGFGRAISEVGAVMIVGGNIEHYTRVMTSAISLETSTGNLEKAMSLGIILIFTTMILNILVFNQNSKK